MIDKFDGQYAFLSNFYECEIKIGELGFPTSEHLFQAEKCMLIREVWQFTNMPDRGAPVLTAGQAKRAGRKVLMIRNWDELKLRKMEEVLYKKFSQHPELKELLLATGDEELVEGNNWGDTYWGKVNGEGENHLGILLMVVREQLRKE